MLIALSVLEDGATVSAVTAYEVDDATLRRVRSILGRPRGTALVPSDVDTSRVVLDVDDEAVDGAG